MPRTIFCNKGNGEGGRGSRTLVTLVMPFACSLIQAVASMKQLTQKHELQQETTFAVQALGCGRLGEAHLDMSTVSMEDIPHGIYSTWKHGHILNGMTESSPGMGRTGSPPPQARV